MSLIQVSTSATDGAAFVPFAGNRAGNGSITNDTGVSLDLRLSPTGAVTKIAAGLRFPFNIVWSTAEVEVRRTDQVATAVTVELEFSLGSLPPSPGWAFDPSGTAAAAVAGHDADADAHQQLAQYRAASLIKARAAIAKLRAGVISSAKILCVGESTTEGFSTTHTGAKATSYPRKLAALLTAYGIPARESSFIGSNTGESAPAGYDSRLTIGDGWVEVTARLAFQNNSTTNALAFAPTQTTDTIEVYYCNATEGVFTVDIGGAALATITCNGGYTVSKTTVSCTRGVQTINVKRVSGNVYIVGVVTSDTQTPEVNIINAGMAGWLAGNFDNADTLFGPLVTFGTLAPALAVINLGINDLINATTAAVFGQHLAAIAASTPTASIVVASPMPFNRTATALWAQYVEAMADTAADAGGVYVDADTRYTSKAVVDAVGFGADALHGTPAGYSDYADMIASAIK